MTRTNWWREWLGDYGIVAAGLALGIGGGFGLMFLLGPALGPTDPRPSLRAEVQRQRVEIDALRRQLLGGGPPPAGLPAEALIPPQELPTK